MNLIEKKINKVLKILTLLLDDEVLFLTKLAENN